MHVINSRINEAIIVFRFQNDWHVEKFEKTWTLEYAARENRAIDMGNSLNASAIKYLHYECMVYQKNLQISWEV